MANQWQRWKGIQKCYPFEEKRLSKWQPPYIVQPKYDGVRCRAVPIEGGNHLLLSSEENVIFSVPHINSALNMLKLGIELDGELYHHTMPFEQIVSRTSRTTNLHPQHEQIQFHIFDIVEKKDQLTRISRLVELGVMFRHPLVRAPFWFCESLQEVMEVYDKLVSEKYEGIIVRNIHAPYERKRSTWVMKFKPKKEDEYLIVGYVEEVSIDGNPKDSLGALVCDSGDGTTFNVGTGFTAEQRKLYWKSREYLAGSYCRVKYQNTTPGKGVPRFPVFVEVI